MMETEAEGGGMQVEYRVRVQLLEIYNEQLRDLLSNGDRKSVV